MPLISDFLSTDLGVQAEGPAPSSANLDPRHSPGQFLRPLPSAWLVRIQEDYTANSVFGENIRELR